MKDSTDLPQYLRIADELRIRTQPKVRGIRRLSHDIALAFQDYFNDHKFNNRNKENAL